MRGNDYDEMDVESLFGGLSAKKIKLCGADERLRWDTWAFKAITQKQNHSYQTKLLEITYVRVLQIHMHYVLVKGMYVCMLLMV